MATHHWTLIDVDRDRYVSELELGPDDVGHGMDKFSVRKRTLRGGLRDGVNVVEVDNGAFRFVLVPDRGMGIWRAWLGDLQLGWLSPVKGPVNPKFVPLDEASGIGFLSGFDELLCRCGLQSNGAPQWDASGRLEYTLHGRIANLPAHQVEVSIDTDAQEIVITGVVDEARLFGNKLRLTSSVRTRWGEPGVRITDQVTNLSARAGDLELLYHINFGPPLVWPGARIVVPVETLAPGNAHSAADLPTWDTYAPQQLDAPEVVMFFELAADQAGRTQTLLHSADGNRGVSLHFNRRQFPFFTLWKNPLMAADGYVTGLEPCINFPNVRRFEKEQGRVATLSAGETRTFEIALEAHGTAERVGAARQAVQQLSHGVEPRIFHAPRPGWSPG